MTCTNEYTLYLHLYGLHYNAESSSNISKQPSA